MREFLKSGIVGKIDINKLICVHNYKDFKKTENGRKMIETYLYRWDKLGFIEGLDDELKERCAVAMEQLAVYLLTENESYKNFDYAFETIGFPMIRRICCGSVGNNEKLNDLDLFNFEKFIKYCKELDIINLIEEVHNIVNDTPIDSAAETCAMGCEMIIRRFNGDERSFNEMKAENINKLREQIKKRNEGTSSGNTNA